MTGEERPKAEDEVLLTVEEVQERLRVSRWTIYRLIKERRLISVTVGRCRRVPAGAVDTYIAELIEEAA